MNTNRLLILAVVVLALFTFQLAPSHAQGLFGGGGLLGGGGGFGGGGFGGGGFGGGGFGGGGPIAAPAPAFGGGGPILGGGGPAIGGGPALGGGGPILGNGPSIGGGAPLLRPEPAIDRPIFGGGGPSAGGLPADDRPLLGDGGGPIISKPDAGSLPAEDRPIHGGGPGIGDGPIAGGLPDVDMPRPAAIPAIDLPGNVRPSQPVTAGRLDDFLNDGPSAGTNDLPQIDPDDRPGGLGGEGPLANQLPGVDRPGIGDGPDSGDRPIIGDGPPLWDRPIVGDRPEFLPDFGENILEEEIHNEIIARRIERAVHVRDRIRDLYYRENHPFCYWWHYMWTNHPVWSWWRVTAPLQWCSWNQCTTYFGWSGTYAQPVQHEYTQQGVYADGRQVKTNAAYTEQALQLARAGAEKLQQAVDEKRTDKLEWLPLGVFSLNDKVDGDPTMFLQIAVSKEAIVAGTYFNAQTNEYIQLAGGLDKETQRVAMTVGDKEDVVIETGMYNLTEDQSSALLHFEGGKIQSWTLVRMPDPQGKQDGAKQGGAS